jgi:hypothetical protein
VSLKRGQTLIGLPSQPVDAQIARPLPHHHGLDERAVKPEELGNPVASDPALSFGEAHP